MNIRALVLLFLLFAIAAPATQAAERATIIIEGGQAYLVLPDGTKLKINKNGTMEPPEESAVDEKIPPVDWSNLPAFKDIRRKIRSHQDWLDYYTETKDYRAFYLLASRAGRVVDVNRSKRISAALMHEPDKASTVLKNWGIDRDVEKYNQEVIEEWKKLYGDEAYIKETKTYIFLGTEKDETFMKYLVNYQQKVFKFYERKFKSKEKAEPFLVMIHPSRMAYVKAGGPGWSAAYFSGSQRALVGFVPEDRNLTWVAQTLIKTFFHEGWHQYFHYHVPNPPIWLDEGLAQIHETTVVQGSSIREGKRGAMHLTFDMVKQAQEVVKSKQTIPMKQMLYMTIQEFQSVPSISYPQTYCFMHFLLHGPRDYRDIPDDIIEALMDGKDRTEALDIALEGFDLEEMENDWREHVLEDMRPVNTPSYFKK